MTVLVWGTYLEVMQGTLRSMLGSYGSATSTKCLSKYRSMMYTGKLIEWPPSDLVSLPHSFPSSLSFFSSFSLPPSLFSSFDPLLPPSLHPSSPSNSSIPPSLPPSLPLSLPPSLSVSLRDQICLRHHHLLSVSGDCYSRAGGHSARRAGMAQRPQS